MAQTEELHHIDLAPIWPEGSGGAAGTGSDRTGGAGGERLPIVLVHGLSSCLRLWDGVAPRLQDLGHRVVACDLRGHGLSPKPEGPYDVETVAADVAALIEGLELGPCLLAGQSYGATVVMQLAADRPDLADRVVCIEGGFLDLGSRYPEWERCRKELAPPPLAGRPLAALRLRMRVERAGWPPEALEAQLACFEVREDGTVAPWLSRERHFEVLHGLWSVDAEALWARQSVPILLLAAERPGSMVKRVSHDDVARCRAVLSDHTMCMVMWMDGHHDLHAQHPEPVARLIHDWAGD